MVMLALRADRLIDVRGQREILKPVVLIEGSRILDVLGPDAAIPENATILDCPGSTIIPGLIDAHVHITSDGGLANSKYVLDETAKSASQLALTGAANARTSLMSGYTTLRDLHAFNYADISLRNMINEERLSGSRLLVSGPGLCITGGHMDKTSLPPEIPISRRVGVADSPEGFRAAVRNNVKMGTDLIKINSDVGSRGTPGVYWREEMSFQEMQAACTEAHKFGRRVAAHTTGGEPIERALEAGVNSIEHGHWLTDRAIELMLQMGAWYVPTLVVNSRNIQLGRDRLGSTAESWDWMLRSYEAKWDSLERARKANVNIVAGSDAGFIVHHGENAEELQELVAGGLTEMEALASATINAAELLGIEDATGSIEPDKLADITVVRGNPLENISQVADAQRITHVIQRGRMVKQDGQDVS